ncbi:hypothetical protein LSAT2_017674 [Lamellibrachia satsuma]|nr:hypothetical protein LSAT2_017674 [Lamellibrachia satsuma]
MGKLRTKSRSVVVFETLHDPHTTLKRYIKLVVLSTMVALFLGAISYAIPVCLKGTALERSRTDVVTSVIAGAALRLDCSALSHTAGNLVQVTWRKNMQRFYQQYSSDGRYRGHATGEIGDRLEPRLKSVGVGHITLFPALPSDDGLYLCEVTRVSDESVGTEVLRKSFGVSVVSGPQIELAMVAQTFAGTVVGTILVFSVFRLIRRRRERQKLEISAEPKPEVLDDDITLSKSDRSPSRSRRGRSTSPRRRPGSNRASTKGSTSRLGTGDGSATKRQVSRRSSSPPPRASAKSSHRNGSTSSISNKLRVIRSYTTGKTMPLGADVEKSSRRVAQRKSARNQAKPGRGGRK